MDRIALYGKLMQYVAIAIATITTGAYVYAAFIGLTDKEMFEQMMSSYLVSGQTRLTYAPFAMVALGLLGLANLVIMACGLRAVWNIGNLCISRDQFLSESGRWLRRLGAVLLVGAVSSIVSRTLSVVLATTNAEGGRMLVLGIGTSEAFLVLAALMMLVLGHVMVLATAIEAENRAFV